MVSTATIAEIAALAGDPARAAMLNTLMDGRALTATELASVAGVTPQTASGHLARLTTAGLLAVEKQGRHRYHRLASPMVAQMVESLSQLAATLAPPGRRVATGPRDLALRTARTCYDHLAGRLGVALTDALLDAGHAEIDGDAGAVTDGGLAFFAGIGIDLERATTPQRPAVVAGVLPALPGLQRAAAASGRRRRRGDLQPRLRAGLDPPGRRQPRGGGHPQGRAGGCAARSGSRSDGDASAPAEALIGGVRHPRGRRHPGTRTPP